MLKHELDSRIEAIVMACAPHGAGKFVLSKITPDTASIERTGDNKFIGHITAVFDTKARKIVLEAVAENCNQFAAYAAGIAEHIRKIIKSEEEKAEYFYISKQNRKALLNIPSALVIDYSDGNIIASPPGDNGQIIAHIDNNPYGKQKNYLNMVLLETCAPDLAKTIREENDKYNEVAARIPQLVKDITAPDFDYNSGTERKKIPIEDIDVQYKERRWDMDETAKAANTAHAIFLDKEDKELYDAYNNATSYNDAVKAVRNLLAERAKGVAEEFKAVNELKKEKADLSAHKLTLLDLSNYDLTKAIFAKGQKIISVRFRNLDNVDLHTCRLFNPMFPGKPSFKNADLSSAYLRDTKLNEADFSGCDMESVILSHSALLPQANFSGCNMQGATLYHTFLPGANFSGCDASKANFGNAFLPEADFSSATFKEMVSFKQANLTKANFDDAIITAEALKYSPFGFTADEADCEGATFNRITVSNMALAFVRANLRDAQFRELQIEKYPSKSHLFFPEADLSGSDFSKNDFRDAYESSFADAICKDCILDNTTLTFHIAHNICPDAKKPLKNVKIYDPVEGEVTPKFISESGEWIPKKSEQQPPPPPSSPSYSYSGGSGGNSSNIPDSNTTTNAVRVAATVGIAGGITALLSQVLKNPEPVPETGKENAESAPASKPKKKINAFAIVAGITLCTAGLIALFKAKSIASTFSKGGNLNK